MIKKNPLTKLQREALVHFFGTQLGQAYFLTGGTALAGFYFHHRKSVDLDLFTFEDIELPIMKQVLAFVAKKTKTVLDHRLATENYHKFFLLGKDEELKIDLVKEQPVHFGKIQSFDTIRVDALENIGSNKITAIFGRTEPKDFVDLYFILKKQRAFSFKKLFEDAKKKDIGLSEFYFAHMLRQVENLRDIPEMLVPFARGKMERYFLSLANRLLLSAKPQA
ncbi:MAG: nucleotidyl transferase AbiEii/AbiGii toxin family protein [Candidatus Levybacteria bacterium]|nr:nucleotidyl transferase AbiEii/AbiGii toxin family protein [Candidatus Levybacteria bacterium]